MRNLKDSNRYRSVTAIAIIGGFIAIAVSNIADVHLRTEVLYSLFWLLIGLIISLEKIATSGSKKVSHEYTEGDN
jgi:hypothetical protein